MREIDDIHKPFIKWMNDREIPFIYHRPDKKSGIKKGWPDFSIFWMSRSVMVEAKTDKGRVSIDQARVIAFIKRSGNKVVICRSVKECIEAVKNILCDGKLGDESLAPEKRPRFEKEFATMKETIASVPGNGTKPLRKDRNGAGLEPFYIANWNGTNIVIARANNGSYKQVRVATPADVINLPKLPI